MKHARSPLQRRQDVQISIKAGAFWWALVSCNPSVQGLHNTFYHFRCQQLRSVIGQHERSNGLNFLKLELKLLHNRFLGQGNYN